MTRLTSQSVDLEHLLLLHAVGELPPREAADFERQLDRDPALRRQSDALRGLTAACDDALARADAVRPTPPAAARRAADRAARAVAAWQEVPAVAGRIAPEPLAQGRAWRLARWPLSAAAALVVGLIVWTFASDPSSIGPQTAAVRPDSRLRGSDGDPADWPGPERARPYRFPRDLSRDDGADGVDSPTDRRDADPPTGPAVAATDEAERAVALFENPAAPRDSTADLLVAGLSLGDGYRGRLAALQSVSRDAWADDDGGW